MAKKCNIKCIYCFSGKTNSNYPGTASKVITPEEALSIVERAVKRHEYVKVAGISGPGDPLANLETFETLSQIKKRFPSLIRCICTNGLLIEDYLEFIEEYVDVITITMNTLNAREGSRIYKRVNYKNKIYKGREGSKLLIKKQLKGLKLVHEKGLLIKINTVLIPEINSNSISKLAKKISRYADIMNIIPLVSNDLLEPTMYEIVRIREECEKYLSQFYSCRRCRSDALGTLKEGYLSTDYL